MISAKSREGRADVPRRGARDFSRVGTGWDALLCTLAALILTYVWRVQDLFTILAVIKFVALASLAAFGLYFIDQDRRRSLAVANQPIIRYTILILGLMVLSVPGSLYPGLSFRFIINDHIKTFILMVLLAASARSFKDVERYAAVQVFGAGLYCVFILLRFDIGDEGRLGDLVYYDANDLGMLIVCTLPLVAYFLRSGVPVHLRIAAAGIVPIAIMTIVKTGSRGAFLGLLSVVGFMLFRFTAIPKRLRFGAVAAMALVLFVSATGTYWEMMRTLLNPTEDYNWSGNADGGRMEVWKRGVSYMLQNPVFGVGARAFPVAEGTISPLAGRQAYGIGLKWSAAHNSFVEIGAELGVGGLILFVLLLLTAFRACAAIGRAPPAKKNGAVPAEAALGQALCATLVGYVVTGSFLSQAYGVYFYATLGIIAALVKTTRAAGVPRRAGPEVGRAVRGNGQATRPRPRSFGQPVRGLIGQAKRPGIDPSRH